MNYVQQRKIGEVIDGCWIPPTKSINVELLALPSVYDKTVTGLITCVSWLSFKVWKYSEFKLLPFTDCQLWEVLLPA